MNRSLWSWILPVGQLVLAVACHVYDPHEYRERARRDGVVGNPEYTWQHSPALSGRLSQGVNFPALVLAYPLRNETDAVYKRNSPFTLVWIAPNDVAFFAGVALFWWWVGWEVDEKRRRNPKAPFPRCVRIMGLTCGTAFGVLAGAYGGQMISGNWNPGRQVGVCGLIWAAGLVAYFVSRLMPEFGLARNPARGFAVIFPALIAGVALWIGGPLGATQAIGEYLRPSRVEHMPVLGRCVGLDAPSPEVVRVIERYQKLYNLSLQKVVSCNNHNFGQFPQDDPKFAAATFDGLAQRSWQPLEKGRCFQYRRNFAVVVVADCGETIMEAALIQSRWDYLRLNWNKTLLPFSWPYPRAYRK